MHGPAGGRALIINFSSLNDFAVDMCESDPGSTCRHKGDCIGTGSSFQFQTASCTVQIARYIPASGRDRRESSAGVRPCIRIPLSDPDLDPESAPDHNLLASLLPPPDLVERVRTSSAAAGGRGTWRYNGSSGRRRPSRRPPASVGAPAACSDGAVGDGDCGELCQHPPPGDLSG